MDIYDTERFFFPYNSSNFELQSAAALPWIIRTAAQQVVYK